MSRLCCTWSQFRCLTAVVYDALQVHLGIHADVHFTDLAWDSRFATECTCCTKSAAQTLRTGPSPRWRSKKKASAAPVSDSGWKDWRVIAAFAVYRVCNCSDSACFVACLSFAASDVGTWPLYSLHGSSRSLSGNVRSRSGNSSEAQASKHWAKFRLRSACVAEGVGNSRCVAEMRRGGGRRLAELGRPAALDLVPKQPGARADPAGSPPVLRSSALRSGLLLACCKHLQACQTDAIRLCLRAAALDHTGTSGLGGTDDKSAQMDADGNNSRP